MLHDTTFSPVQYTNPVSHTCTASQTDRQTDGRTTWWCQ